MARPRVEEKEETGLETVGELVHRAYLARGSRPDPGLLCGGGTCTHLPIPQVAAGRGLENEDVVGVEGGGPG